MSKGSRLSDKELKALIALMDEEDESARQHVVGRLKRVLLTEPERIEAIIPELDMVSCKQVEELLQDVRWDRLERSFQRLSRLPDADFDLEWNR